ncbi:hypothetical protein GEMRC1_012714 [Eukaryota sp. GEM-RC1]
MSTYSGINNYCPSRGRSDEDSTARMSPRTEDPSTASRSPRDEGEATTMFGPRIRSPSGSPPGSRGDEAPLKDSQTTNPGPLDDSQTTSQGPLDGYISQTTPQGALHESTPKQPLKVLWMSLQTRQPLTVLWLVPLSYPPDVVQIEDLSREEEREFHKLRLEATQKELKAAADKVNTLLYAKPTHGWAIQSHKHMIDEERRRYNNAEKAKLVQRQFPESSRNPQNWHRAAIPNELIPFASSQDSLIGIDDRQLWQMAKFDPFNVLLRQRLKEAKHFLIRNVPPMTPPEVITRYLAGKFDPRRGDTYRFPVSESWDPAHGISVEPLMETVHPSGQSLVYEYPAWYQYSLSTKKAACKDVAISTAWLPETPVYDNLPPGKSSEQVYSDQLIDPTEGSNKRERQIHAALHDDRELLDSTKLPSQEEYPGQSKRPETVIVYKILDRTLGTTGEIKKSEFDELTRQESSASSRDPLTTSQLEKTPRVKQKKRTTVLRSPSLSPTPPGYRPPVYSPSPASARKEFERQQEEWKRREESRREPSPSEPEEPSSSEEDQGTSHLTSSAISGRGHPKTSKSTLKSKNKFRPKTLDSEDPKKILNFILDFTYWSKEIRGQGDGPYSTELGEPVHGFDLVRTSLKEVDPSECSKFISTELVYSWRMLNELEMEGTSDEKLWLYILLLTQFPSSSTAIQALKRVQCTLSQEPTQAINAYLKGVITIIQRSTAVPTVHQHERKHVPANLIADVMLKKLDPQGESSLLTDLKIHWVDRLTSRDNQYELPQFINELKAAYIDWKRSSATVSTSRPTEKPAERRQHRGSKKREQSQDQRRGPRDEVV